MLVLNVQNEPYIILMGGGKEGVLKYSESWQGGDARKIENCLIGAGAGRGGFSLSLRFPIPTSQWNVWPEHLDKLDVARNITHQRF